MSTTTSTTSITTLSPFAWEERPAATRPGSVRLTRRGRMVIFVVAFVAVLGLGIALGTQAFAGETPGTPAPTRVVMVGSGETLWAIAADAAGDGDVRAMVDRIEDLNALDGGMVVAGQRLRVPVE